MNHTPFTLAFILCWNGEVVAHEAALGFNEQIQAVFKCNRMPAISHSSLGQAAVESIKLSNMLVFIGKKGIS